MTKQERNIVYKEMLHEFESGRVLYGFCWGLNRLQTKAFYTEGEGYWFPSTLIEDYPELVANKPLEAAIGGYWFLPEYLGRSKRIEILRKVIAEIDENGN